MERDSGSFRDPSGYVFYNQGRVFRTIAPCYKDDWEVVTGSGLMRKSLELGYILDFKEEPNVEYFYHKEGFEPLNVWKVLSVKKLPFISYPYEWSFSQMRDAALLTLDLQRIALEHGCILKDASAYNIQFYKGKPIFIDMLSFERWKDGQPWQAYGQFCMHFLCPLALMAKTDIRLGYLAREWIDGIPIDLACNLLPMRAKLSPGLFLHLFLHSSMRQKHADGRKASKKVAAAKLSLSKMLGVIDSLRNAVSKLKLPKQDTEWAEYYTDTNYSSAALAAKQNLISEKAKQYSGNLALDMGANTGYFSNSIATFFESVLSVDYDPMAVDIHYKNKNFSNVYPYIIDISNPSPGGGWAERERKSFSARCKADFIVALALVHHLFFTFGIPFEFVAEYLALLLKDNGVVTIEFVPKNDSQVQRMLAVRDDLFSMYTEDNFVSAFTNSLFTLESTDRINDSDRTLFTFRKA